MDIKDISLLQNLYEELKTLKQDIRYLLERVTKLQTLIEEFRKKEDKIFQEIETIEKRLFELEQSAVKKSDMKLYMAIVSTIMSVLGFLLGIFVKKGG